MDESLHDYWSYQPTVITPRLWSNTLEQCQTTQIAYCYHRRTTTASLEVPFSGLWRLGLGFVVSQPVQNYELGTPRRGTTEGTLYRMQRRIVTIG